MSCPLYHRFTKDPSPATDSRDLTSNILNILCGPDIKRAPSFGCSAILPSPGKLKDIGSSEEATHLPFENFTPEAFSFSLIGHRWATGRGSYACGDARVVLPEPVTMELGEW